MQVEVSLGEVVDKYTILLIKERMITDHSKLLNVKKERQYLEDVLKHENFSDTEMLDRLTLVNEKLWHIEDRIRIKESLKLFDDEFIALARSVYRTNDERARIKRQINSAYGSNFVEEKQYTDY
jgi:hypothetical protein